MCGGSVTDAFMVPMTSQGVEKRRLRTVTRSRAARRPAERLRIGVNVMKGDFTARTPVTWCFHEHPLGLLPQGRRPMRKPRLRLALCSRTPETAVQIIPSRNTAPPRNTQSTPIQSVSDIRALWAAGILQISYWTPKNQSTKPPMIRVHPTRTIALYIVRLRVEPTSLIPVERQWRNVCQQSNAIGAGKRRSRKLGGPRSASGGPTRPRSAVAQRI